MNLLEGSHRKLWVMFLPVTCNSGLEIPAVIVAIIRVKDHHILEIRPERRSYGFGKYPRFGGLQLMGRLVLVVRRVLSALVVRLLATSKSVPLLLRRDQWGYGSVAGLPALPVVALTPL